MIHFTSQFNINPNVSYADKSISHRALIISAIASGPSTICNLSLCDDVLTTANCLRTLGAKVDIVGSTANVTPIKTPCDNVILDCKNSGTTARLLAGLVSGLGITARFVGDQSLQKRPMDRVIQPLQELGANITISQGELFCVHPSKLIGKVIHSKVNSAQVKSAVLLAGLNADGTTQYVEKIPTRNHTENLLNHCGVDVTNCAVVKTAMQPLNITIPNDISSASFLIALALLTNQALVLPNVGVNDYRAGFLSVLQRAGVKIALQNQRLEFGEKVADICLEKCAFEPLFATSLDVVNAIDEVPVLCALAIATAGEHSFESVCELQYKECNRIQAIMDMAKACGQRATFDGNNLTIVSNGRLSQNPSFCSFDDHRIAMCEAILCIACGGGVVDRFPVQVSFPNFLQAVGVVPKKFCVIGSDVSKSLSPKLMMHLATQANVCCSYDAVSLNASIIDQDLLQAINGYDGVNVTIPFKNRVAKLLCAKKDSINTIGKSVLPTSTDGYGVQMALLENDVDVAGKPLWIVGAGGGAEACVESLAGNCQIQIVNRTKQNADKLREKYNLATDIKNPFGVLSFVPECEFEQCLQLPNSCQFVFISAYNGKSGLRDKAQSRGIKVVDGLQMLYHQGAKSFSLWTNTSVQKDYPSFLKYLNQN